VAAVVLVVVVGAVTAVALFAGRKKGPDNPAAAAATTSDESGAAGLIPVVPGAPGASAGAASVSATRPPTSTAPAKAPTTKAVPPAGGTVDNFDGIAPDTNAWGLYESTSDATGARFLKSNIVVQNGELDVIGAGKDPTGKTDTSGGLCWCGPGGNRLYGTWEVRARFDAGAGYGPVIGLWPQSNKATDGSITFGGAPEAARHTARGFVAAPGVTHTDKTVSADLTTWHVYRVEWQAGSVKMYFDGNLFYDSATIAGTVVPKVPMHLYLQLMVGPENGVPAATSATPDKVLMHIDYAKM
jgi:beta-glucanase (GH16 family)